MTSYCRSRANYAAHERPTVGDQKMSFYGADHLGWVLCDGRELSKRDYAMLYSVIGDTFGTPEDTTLFMMPDFRGRVPGMIGRAQPEVDSSPTPWALGDISGNELHRLTIGEMPAHTHGSVNVTGNTNGNGNTSTVADHVHAGTTANAGTHNHGGVTGSGGYAASSHSVSSLTGTESADDTGSHTHTISNDGNHNHTFTTQPAGTHNHQIYSTGGSDYHNNMQPTLFAGNMFIYSGRINRIENTQYPYFAAGLN